MTNPDWSKTFKQYSVILVPVLLSLAGWTMTIHDRSIRNEEKLERVKDIATKNTETAEMLLKIELQRNKNK